MIGRQDDARYCRVRRVVLLAGAADAGRREEIIHRECADDASLEAEVREYLGVSSVATECLFDARRATLVGAASPPFELGPFRVRREIGRGGMGIVYEATDSRTGAVVALKEVYPHLLVLGTIAERFAREADAGRKIDHRHVVRTHGLERVEAGGAVHHLLVMEYVEGRTLRELSRSLGRLPEALLREVALQVAAGLAAIHAAGIVHRDIKPENILVTDDRHVRIMDLGIARLLEASASLTSEGQFVGSVLYAAPEQCRGERVGPAADLYSLGVVLHELASGENFFARPRPLASIRAQIEETPPPLDGPPSECSPFVSAVVATLLAKRPEDRFPSAADLHRALSDGEAGRFWSEQIARGGWRRPPRPRLPVSREVAFRGRREVLGMLRQAFEDACQGRGSTVLIEGEEGLGKTRLVDDFLESVTAEGRVLLAGSFTAASGIGGVTEAVRDGLGGGLEAEIERGLGGGPEAAALLGLLRGETAEAHRDAFVHGCGRLLDALTSARPVVWVADDAHLASPAGQAALASLARAAAGHRALLVITARPGSGAAALSAELARAGPFHRIPLPRLSQEEVEAVLEAAFRSEVVARQVSSVVAERSEGVPLFVLELIASLRGEGFVTPLPSGEWVVARPVSELALPAAARDLFSVRLQGLPRDLREVVDVAAVAGAAFDAGPVATVLGRPLVSVLRTLAEIERRHGVVRAHGRRYRFDHVLLADHAYETLPELLRAEYHGLLADALRPADGSAGRALAAELARHYLLSGRSLEARPFLLDALDHAAGHHRIEDCLRLAEQALRMEGLLAGGLRARVLLKHCSALHAAGRPADCRAAAREARRIAVAAGDAVLRAEAHVHEGIAVSCTGQFRRAAARFRAARILARANGAVRLEAGSLANLGVSLVRSGKQAQAGAALREAMVTARRAGDEASELLALVNLAALVHRQGHVDAARDGYAEAIGLARRLSRRPTESYAESCLGLLAFSAGQFPEAGERLRRALSIATETGSRPAQTEALAGLSLVHHACGRHVEALRTRECLLALRVSAGDRSGEAQALAARGESRLWLGDLSGARRDMEAALALADSIGEPAATMDVLIALAELEWNAGDLGAAGRALDRARGLLGHAIPATLAIACRCGLGRLAAEEGRPGPAREWLEEAARMAADGGQAGHLLLVEAHLMALPGGAAARFADRLGALEARASHHHRMEARLLLWRAGGDVAHLREARRLAREARDLAGPPHSEAMSEKLRLHREIEMAWSGLRL